MRRTCSGVIAAGGHHRGRRRRLRSGGCRGRPPNGAPNVVVLMSDDQTLEEMRFMPATERLIGAAGADLPETTHELAALLPIAGDVHDRPVRPQPRRPRQHGAGGRLRQPRRRAHAARLVAARRLLDDPHRQVPERLRGQRRRRAAGLVGVARLEADLRLLRLQLLRGGQIVTYGSLDEDPDEPADPATYSTDVFTDKAVEAIDERAPSRQPFFLSVALPGAARRASPEGGGRRAAAATPPSPAARARRRPRRRAAAAAAELQRGRRLRQAAAIRRLAPLTAPQIARATRNYRCRGESLMAIDEGVKRIVDALRGTGELSDTLVIYTSDNGFFHGEHRIRARQEPRLRGGGPGAAPDARPRHPARRRGRRRWRPTPTSPRRSSRRPAQRPTSRSTAARCSRSREHPDRMHGRELLIEQDTPRGRGRQAARDRVRRGADQPLEVRPLLGRRRSSSTTSATTPTSSRTCEPTPPTTRSSRRWRPGSRSSARARAEVVPQEAGADHEAAGAGAQGRRALPHRRRLRRQGPPSRRRRPGSRIVRVSFRVAGEPSGTVREAAVQPQAQLAPAALRAEAADRGRRRAARRPHPDPPRPGRICR